MPGIGYTQRARASRQRTAPYFIEGRDASSRAHVALTPLPSCPASYAPAHHAPSSSPFHGAPIHGAAVATAPPPHTPSRRRPWRLSASDASLGRASAKPSQPFRNSGREASSAKASVQPLQILSATVADPQCNRCRSSVQPLQILSATVADPQCNRCRSSVQPLQILSATVADPQCNRCRSSIRLQSSSTLTSIPSTTFSILGRSRLRNVSMRSPSMKLVASWVFRSVRNSRHF